MSPKGRSRGQVSTEARSAEGSAANLGAPISTACMQSCFARTGWLIAQGLMHRRRTAHRAR